ncbi:hypothetical protein ACIHFE_08665 [Streptomyces sp. NPDC052396]|uniref:hypothetical protein n=1 Tax=Streptomyces sp. NPDC052396 TaxID=3365689 RepID=UPI0037D141FC
MTLLANHSTTDERLAVVVAMAIARAWQDDDYRAELIAGPKSVLAEEGFDCPAGIDLEIVQDTAEAKYVSLPPNAADSTTAMALVEQALPLEPGRELRLVQSTDTKWYLVLPMPPTSLQATDTPEILLDRATAIENGWIFSLTNVIIITSAVSTTISVITAL